MQKEFTKADLKDGMILYSEDRKKSTLVSDYYTTREDLEFTNGKIIRIESRKEITKIEYGDKVVWEAPTKHMTSEEMRQKLEELTGEKIEIEPSREEMVGVCYEFCKKIKCTSDCVLDGSGDCVFKDYPNERLKECYEKVMEDGRKES